MTYLPQPANNDSPRGFLSEPNQRVLEWLNRLSRSGLAFNLMARSFDHQEKTAVEETSGTPLTDDWQTISSLCGHSVNDFAMAGSVLPLTNAEIDHFRRNHRGTETHVNRDFIKARSDLPSPLSELYGLYLHRTKTDAEAALFVAQATGSTRVSRVMADLLAIGSFAQGLEQVTYMGLTYSVPAAFDTSDVIDRANHEAARRMALPINHPAHLLKLAPDEIGILASNMAEAHAMSPSDFLEKANLLAEARQDVARLPISQHFATAVIERDLPMQQGWVTRIFGAYARIFEAWVVGLPEFESVLQ